MNILSSLASDFFQFYTPREQLFWELHMGLADDGSVVDALRRADAAYRKFASDQRHVHALQRMATPSADEAVVQAWLAFFAARATPSSEATRVAEELAELEQRLGAARRAVSLTHLDPTSGAHVAASNARLRFMVRTDPDEQRRMAAFEGMRAAETFALENGLLEIIAKRNELARLLGHEDFYSLSLARSDRTEKRSLFGLLDRLLRKTERATRDVHDKLATRFGEGALAPHNLPFANGGGLTHKLDPYFEPGNGLALWGQTLSDLGVGFKNASLTLDLVARPNKSDNAFCQLTTPAFAEGGRFLPAQINITTSAMVSEPGAGSQALRTLLHEGGHAAHFANISGEAPCLSQEPLSMSVMETQGRFFESFIDDPTWLATYPRSKDGRRIPDDLIRDAVAINRATRLLTIRRLATVPLVEKALYELPKSELTAERVLKKVRAVEASVQLISASPRPTLSLPHLLASQTSAYYHSYLVAEVAVEQIKSHLLRKCGGLVGNPRVGRELLQHCWLGGSRVTVETMVRNMVGAELSEDDLVDACCSHDAASKSTTEAIPRPVQLHASVRVVHGRQLIAAPDRTFTEAPEEFRGWVGREDA